MNLVLVMGYIAIIFIVGYLVCRCAPMVFNFFIEAATILLILFFFAMLTAFSIGVSVTLGFGALIVYALYIAYVSIKKKLH